MFSIFSHSQDQQNLLYPQYSTFIPPGLSNPGNLCYFNSLLQTFASSSHWTNFFNNNAHIHPVLEEFSIVINQLRQPFQIKPALQTSKCRKELSKIGISTSISRQQDFHEFYTHLLDILESLFKQYTTVSFSAFATKRIFPSNFIYEETVECPVCGSMTRSINQTSFVILDIEHSTLTNALNNYFGRIIVRSRCSRCGEYNNRIMSRKLLFLPKVILFFINRRQYTESLRPSLAPFSFPLCLNMSEYSAIQREYTERQSDNFLKISLNGISEVVQNRDSEYKLTSVVTFTGSDNAGHYMSYRIHKNDKPPFPERWICANDKKVSAVKLETVLKQKTNVLLLQYEM